MNAFSKAIGRLRREQTGSAMVMTLLVMAVLTSIGGAVFVIGLNNMQNSARDRLQGRAFSSSEAGIAQALAFIRTNGMGTLRCDEAPTGPSLPPPSDCTKLWGKNNPKVISLTGGRQYSVWFQRIQGFAPPANKSATFVVHATGTAGTGPGLRKVDQTIVVRPLSYPIGIYADDIVDAGTPQVRKESLFSQDCVTGREKMTFVGDDPYYGIPASAHSTQYVAEKVNSGCSNNNSNNIHRPRPPITNPGPCNVTYRYDQDALGADLTGTTCQGLPPPAYPQTSFFDVNALKALGYVNPRGLTDAEYAALKSKAQEQGTYFTNDKFPNPDEPPAYPNAVYYWNLRPGGGTVEIQTELNEYGASHCGERSIVIVVEGGDLHMNAGADLVGAIFVPDGNYRGNGNHAVIGTLYARTIDKLTGTADFTLEGPTSNCFFDNMPGGLLSVTSTRFRELDR